MYLGSPDTVGDGRQHRVEPLDVPHLQHDAGDAAARRPVRRPRPRLAASGFSTSRWTPCANQIAGHGVMVTRRAWRRRRRRCGRAARGGRTAPRRSSSAAKRVAGGGQRIDDGRSVRKRGLAAASRAWMPAQVSRANDGQAEAFHAALLRSRARPWRPSCWFWMNASRRLTWGTSWSLPRRISRA